MPALTTAAAANPFGAAAQVRIQFYRVPSMHLPGDDEGVVEYFLDGTSNGSGMDPAWFSPVSALTSTKPATPLGEYSGFGHGTPGYVPTLQLNLVPSGGGVCMP